MNIKIIIGAIIGGILSTIKAAGAYHRAIEMINRNQILYITLCSPLTLDEAEEMYKIAQAYGISADCVIECDFQMRGDVKAIVRKIEQL